MDQGRMNGGLRRQPGRTAVPALLLILFATSGVGQAGGAAPMRTCFGSPATIAGPDGRGRVEGTPRADVIVTGPGGTMVEAGGGNDLICAGAGADRIEGGLGSDRIEARAGDDTVEGGNGSDRVDGGSGRDTLIGERGNDVLLGGAGSRDFADGGLGDDTVFGGAGDEDQVIGGVGNEQLHGGPGDSDVLRGDHGRDLFDGGSGAHDAASFAVSGFTGANSFGGTGVVVNLAEGRALQDGRDHLRGIEDVIGSPFRDAISGDASANVLYGAGGDDALLAIGPGDSAQGGAGSDVCGGGFATESSCGLEAAGSSPAIEVDLAGGPSGTSLAAVVRLPPLLPGAGMQKVEVPGVTMRVGFESGAWVLREQPLPVLVGDSCVAASPSEARCPIAGKPDAVLLDGGAGADLIEVEASVPPYVSAFIDGEVGADTLVGGAGDDNLSGQPGLTVDPVDLLYGRGGDDSLANAALLDGGAGSDLLISAACVDQEVRGGAGIDSVSFARSGGLRGVFATLGGAAVENIGGAGRCHSAADEATTRIDRSVERIEGSRGPDVLRGDTAANTLLGRGGDDRLEGGAGDDILIAGTGQDQLFGGAGFDRLYAAEGSRDRPIDCGDPGQGVAVSDPSDGRPSHCTRVKRPKR
jgi:Ca2+-binding RTX toxin-like protein